MKKKVVRGRKSGGRRVGKKRTQKNGAHLEPEAAVLVSTESVEKAFKEATQPLVNKVGAIAERVLLLEHAIEDFSLARQAIEKRISREATLVLSSNEKIFSVLKGIQQSVVEKDQRSESLLREIREFKAWLSSRGVRFPPEPPPAMPRGGLDRILEAIEGRFPWVRKQRISDILDQEIHRVEARS